MKVTVTHLAFCRVHVLGNCWALRDWFQLIWQIKALNPRDRHCCFLHAAGIQLSLLQYFITPRLSLPSPCPQPTLCSLHYKGQELGMWQASCLWCACVLVLLCFLFSPRPFATSPSPTLLCYHNFALNATKQSQKTGRLLFNRKLRNNCSYISEFHRTQSWTGKRKAFIISEEAHTWKTQEYFKRWFKDTVGFPNNKNRQTTILQFWKKSMSWPQAMAPSNKQEACIYVTEHQY